MWWLAHIAILEPVISFIRYRVDESSSVCILFPMSLPVWACFRQHHQHWVRRDQVSGWVNGLFHCLIPSISNYFHIIFHVNIQLHEIKFQIINAIKQENCYQYYEFFTFSDWILQTRLSTLFKLILSPSSSSMLLCRNRFQIYLVFI